jgi:monoterpene epsilon-lactone hydrolase
VSIEQRENPKAILRQSAFPADINVSGHRRQFLELTSAKPMPAEVTMTAAALGGVPVAEITVDRVEPRHVVLYFHGVARQLRQGELDRARTWGAALARHVGVPTRCS